jgi:hypothetical protein
MAQSLIETGGEVRPVELLKSELGLREDAATERRPSGSTDESVHCAAFTIRSAPRLPVHPGCEIWFACMAMHRTMRVPASARSRKMKSRREWFFGFLPPVPTWNTWGLRRQRRSYVFNSVAST